MNILSLNHRCIINLNRYFASKAFENIPIFKSSYSLDQIYPNSSVNQQTHEPQKSETKFTGHIPMEKLDISYCKSSGPGGQHVNTTNTKVTVRFHLSSVDWIPMHAKQRLMTIHKNNINKDGYWIIRSDKTRAQMMNVADCMDKLRCYITEASQPIKVPSEETLEIARERRERAVYKRLDQKRVHSNLKRQRNDYE